MVVLATAASAQVRARFDAGLLDLPVRWPVLPDDRLDGRLSSPRAASNAGTRLRLRVPRRVGKAGPHRPAPSSIRTTIRTAARNVPGWRWWQEWGQRPRRRE
ncbi:hypothetical protein [Lapillicoccus sp.]|uniref:hypothetical protein n=1 Tax=Lapillicoccus sp. TaxID=1909287 RepID=UPI0039836D68